MIIYRGILTVSIILKTQLALNDGKKSYSFITNQRKISHKKKNKKEEEIYISSERLLLISLYFVFL